ncbi:superoxide dismutase [Candidatus Dependentiae bacterium]
MERKKKTITITITIKLFCIVSFICIGVREIRTNNKFTRKNLNKSREIIMEEKTPKEKERFEVYKEYTVKEELKPWKLTGISDEQINDHWKLYQGYVKQVNMLNLELKKMALAGKVGTLDYADRRRRYGFEYNGMVLHEYYFGNLKSGPKVLEGLLDGPLKKAIVNTWGSFDAWKEDFIATGKTRGIGWAILYQDPQNGRLTNNFIAEHQNGPIAGFKPLLVMDVWEHAYMVDHNAGGRGAYIDAFLQNIDWQVVESRFTS